MWRRASLLLLTAACSPFASAVGGGDDDPAGRRIPGADAALDGALIDGALDGSGSADAPSDRTDAGGSCANCTDLVAQTGAGTACETTPAFDTSGSSRMQYSGGNAAFDCSQSPGGGDKPMQLSGPAKDDFRLAIAFDFKFTGAGTPGLFQLLTITRPTAASKHTVSLFVATGQFSVCAPPAPCQNVSQNLVDGNSHRIRVVYDATRTSTGIAVTIDCTGPTYTQAAMTTPGSEPYTVELGPICGSQTGLKGTLNNILVAR